MSERNGLRENETNQNEPDSWVSIREAASLLGVSERSVQMQAKSGKRHSRKVGGRWQVHVGSQNEGNETKDSRKRSEENEATNLHIQALLAEKDARIADLQKELEQRNRGEAELRTLMLADRRELQELRQRMALLLPAAPEAETPTDLPPPGRSEAVSERESAAGVYQDGHDGKGPITGVADQTEHRDPGRRWWQVWKRRQ